MLRRLILALALLLAPLAAGGTALAHQQKIAISTLSLNPRTGMIEIAHQVPVHDAEHALKAQGATNPDIIGSAKSREAFAAYVTRRFLLELNGTAASPAYVGSEIIGGSLWVYQEVPAPGGGRGRRCVSTRRSSPMSGRGRRTGSTSAAGRALRPSSSKPATPRARRC